LIEREYIMKDKTDETTLLYKAWLFIYLFYFLIYYLL
jgi:hypothetical protein